MRKIVYTMYTVKGKEEGKGTGEDIQIGMNKKKGG